MQEKKRRCGETFAETQRPILSYQKKMISSLWCSTFAPQKKDRCTTPFPRADICKLFRLVPDGNLDVPFVSLCSTTWMGRPPPGVSVWMSGLGGIASLTRIHDALGCMVVESWGLCTACFRNLEQNGSLSCGALILSNRSQYIQPAFALLIWHHGLTFISCLTPAAFFSSNPRKWGRRPKGWGKVRERAQPACTHQ